MSRLSHELHKIECASPYTLEELGYDKSMSKRQIRLSLIRNYPLPESQDGILSLLSEIVPKTERQGGIWTNNLFRIPVCIITTILLPVVATWGWGLILAPTFIFMYINTFFEDENEEAKELRHMAKRLIKKGRIFKSDTEFSKRLKDYKKELRRLA